MMNWKQRETGVESNTNYYVSVERGDEGSGRIRTLESCEDSFRFPDKEVNVT